MSKISIQLLLLWINDLITSFASSVIFYTIFPLPSQWITNWQRIARWGPMIGLLIGLGLATSEICWQFLGLPHLTSSALTTTCWVIFTGGLHLDGAMDTADGLSVNNPERRLEVMKDSFAGAFGAISAIIILLLKVTALSEIALPLWLALPTVAGWARWGQVLAIANYPYLRAEGKGAFHRESISLPQDVLLGLFCLLAWSSLWYFTSAISWLELGLIVLVNLGIAWGSGYWFHYQLGGHTGDTYGAVVEWSEVLMLCYLTIF